MVASGVRRSSFALRSDMTTTAAPPSLMPEALPAVTEPSFLKAGFSPARRCAVGSPRGCASVAQRSVSPLFAGGFARPLARVDFPPRGRAARLFRALPHELVRLVLVLSL